MPFAALSVRDRRALQQGAVILVAALVYVLGVRPSRERRAQLLERLDAERAVLARERAVVNGRGTSDTAKSVAGGPKLFTGGDAVIASASLVDYLASEAERHEVWLQQAVTTPPKSANAALVDLEVKVRAEGDLRGLLGWLSALERGPMLSQVQSLDVRGAQVDEESGTSPLAISATVRSLAVRPGGAP
jgi:hypothetical protein